jgi:hypothetical protein
MEQRRTLCIRRFVQSKGEEKSVGQQQQGHRSELQELVVFLFSVDREHDGDT